MTYATEMIDRYPILLRTLFVLALLTLTTAHVTYAQSSRVEAQLEYVDPMQKLALETYDATLGILGGYNTRALSGIDPKRQAISSRAHAPLFKIMSERSSAGDLRWCGTLFPTHASAQDANMSLSDRKSVV